MQHANQLHVRPVSVGAVREPHVAGHYIESLVAVSLLLASEEKKLLHLHQLTAQLAYVALVCGT